MQLVQLKNGETLQFDELKWESEIQKQCGVKVKSEEIIRFINEGPYDIYYINEKLQANTKKSEDAKFLFINTGCKVIGKNYFLYASVIRSSNSTQFYGGIFGSIEYVVKKSNSLNNQGKDFSDKLQRIRNNVFEEKDKYGECLEFFPSLETVTQYSDSNESSFTTFGKLLQNLNFSISDKYEDVEPNVNNYKQKDSFVYNNEHYSSSSYVISDLVDQIYNILLINNWKEKQGLSRYIKIIGSRIQQLMEQNRSEYYIVNKIKSVIVNTGLLDKYNSDILVLYKWYENPGCYRPDKIIESKKDIIEEGFSMEQAGESIKPINFIDGDMYLRNVTIDHFDITQRALSHILETRIDRFPEEIRKLPIDVIAGKITQNLQLGVKMLQRNYTYARPSYSGNLKRLCWLMPLYINRSFSDEPELVMVISKEEYFYEIKTIYVYDDSIKDRITAMELYRIGW